MSSVIRTTGFSVVMNRRLSLNLLPGGPRYGTPKTKPKKRNKTKFSVRRDWRFWVLLLCQTTVLRTTGKRYSIVTNGTTSTQHTPLRPEDTGPGLGDGRAKFHVGLRFP